MADPVEHLRWHEWARDAWTEKRPAPRPMTDTERLDFLGEYCKHEQKDRHHVIVDCLGQKTEEMDFREAIDIAAARFYAANE
jgi:hypothetical protein